MTARGAPMTVARQKMAMPSLTGFLQLSEAEVGDLGSCESTLVLFRGAV